MRQGCGELSLFIVLRFKQTLAAHRLPSRYIFSSDSSIYVAYVKICALKKFISDITNYDIISDLLACFVSEDISSDLSVLTQSFPFRVYNACVRSDDMSSPLISTLLAFNSLDSSLPVSVSTASTAISDAKIFNNEFLLAFRTLGCLELNVDFIRDIFSLKSSCESSPLSKDLNARVTNYVKEYRRYVERCVNLDSNSLSWILCNLCSVLYSYICVARN